jgi:thiamine pyrophosphate-dependent acetolactate synthase large subunit-like protein
MTLQLSTIVQEKIKINIAIINNGYLGMVRQWQEFFYESNYEATPLVSPDFVKLADAHGIAGRAVSTRAELADAVNEARSAPGAYLLNFMVEKQAPDAEGQAPLFGCPGAELFASAGRRLNQLPASWLLASFFIPQRMSRVER